MNSNVIWLCWRFSNKEGRRVEEKWGGRRREGERDVRCVSPQCFGLTVRLEKISELVQKFGRWERDEERFKYLLEYVVVS